MPEQVDECPYCGGTNPHQGPTGCPPIVFPRETVIRSIPGWLATHEEAARKGLEQGAKNRRDACFHPGVFSTKHGDGTGPDTEYCGTCGENVPYTEL